MCLETALKIGKLAAWESVRRDTMSAAVATTKNINSTTLRLSSLSELLHSPATELLAAVILLGTTRARRYWQHRASETLLDMSLGNFKDSHFAEPIFFYSISRSESFETVSSKTSSSMNSRSQALLVKITIQVFEVLQRYLQNPNSTRFGRGLTGPHKLAPILKRERNEKSLHIRRFGFVTGTCIPNFMKTGKGVWS